MPLGLNRALFIDDAHAAIGIVPLLLPWEHAALTRGPPDSIGTVRAAALRARGRAGEYRYCNHRQRFEHVILLCQISCGCPERVTFRPAHDVSELLNCFQGLRDRSGQRKEWMNHARITLADDRHPGFRSEEHTSELQSRLH